MPTFTEFRMGNTVRQTVPTTQTRCVAEQAVGSRTPQVNGSGASDMNNSRGTSRVVVDVNDGVADVRFNRPDKLNALDTAMFRELVETSASLARRTDVRAVVLSGEGRSFCAGLDFSGFEAMADSNPRESTRQSDGGAGTNGRITHLGQQAVWGWRELPVPVICAVSGHALGGGFQLSLAGDIRLVHPDTKLSVLEIRWGLTPDMCATELLPRLVGIDVAAEMYYTGRMISGREAVELGVCTRLSDDPRQDALELASEIASKNPHAVRSAKALVEQFGRVSTAEAFANERRHISSLIGSPNQTEAVSAFFDKRTPDFADPE